MPRPTGSLTGSIARTANRSAPKIAIGTMTSMPSTQCTVEVDLATEMVSKRTMTADQNRPAPIHSRARSSSAGGVASPSNAASGPARRVSGDTYRIPGPDKSREVVSAANHVKVNILAEVEAHVLVGPTEARGVEVEHDQRRPPPAHRLQEAHPGRIGAWRDHGDRASGKAADAVPGQRLRQRCTAVRLTDREVIEDQAVLPRRTMRFEDGAARVIGDQTHLTAAVVHLRRHRRGKAHRVLDRRLLVLTDLHRALEVHEHPQD